MADNSALQRVAGSAEPMAALMATWLDVSRVELLADWKVVLMVGRRAVEGVS